MMNQVTVLRKDIQVTNDRGEQLECTYFLPDNMIKQKDLPFVIYLHGNSGSRVESVCTLQHLTPNFGLFCFDFSGSGKSQGKYVTMGVNECKDLQCIVEYIRENLCKSSIIIWGRSMGAVTGILYAQNHSSLISGLVLDSPFSDLKKVMQEIASSKTKIPSLIVDGAISLVKSKIQETLNGVDIFNTQIEEKIKGIQCPILFAYGTKDTIILPYHSQTLYKACQSSEKFIVEFEGNHNTIRPLHFFNKIITFIKQNCLKKKLIQQLIDKQPHDIQKNINQKEKISIDIAQIVKQQYMQKELSPITRIQSHNINCNLFNSKPQQHLQSLPSEERKNIKEENKVPNLLFRSPILHQNMREKDQIETQKIQLTQSQQGYNPNSNITPKVQNKQSQPIIHHAKSLSIQEQPQRGISLLSSKQKDYKQTDKLSIGNQNNNKKQIKQSLQNDNQQTSYQLNQTEQSTQQQIIKQIQQFSDQKQSESLQQQQQQRKQSAQKPRKKIFQDNNSGNKQSSHNKSQSQITQQGLLFSNITNEQELIMDQTDQYISNQINLLQDIAINNSTKFDKQLNQQSSMTKKPLNFPFSKSPSAAALPPVDSLNFFNLNNGLNQNIELSTRYTKQPSGSDQIQQKDIQVSPFTIENPCNLENMQLKQNYNIHQANDIRQNNFIERQNIQQQIEKSQSNHKSRQYSFDNNSQSIINGKYLTINNPYGNQISRTVSQQCISPTNIQLLKQQQSQTNQIKEQQQNQQYCSVERQIQILSCQGVLKQDKNNTSDYQQNQQNLYNNVDKNNSSFDMMNNSYLNPTKNPFSFNQQKVASKQNLLQNSNDNKTQIKNINVLIQPIQNIVLTKEQKLFFQADSNGSNTPSNKIALNNNYIQNQTKNQQKIVDKSQIIENQFNTLREAEKQDRIPQQISRNRNQSLTNGLISQSNQLETSQQRQQIIPDTQNILRTRPNTLVSYVPIPQGVYKESAVKNANQIKAPQIFINDIYIREKQTLSPANRQFITPKIITYQTPQQEQSSLKSFANYSNVIQPVLCSQNSHTPLSSFPIVLNKVKQPYDNTQRRYSGVENNDQVQFVSVLTQNIQNRTLREKNQNLESQRGQFQFQEKRNTQCNENMNLRPQQQSSSLFQKVLSEIQNKQQQPYYGEQFNLGNQIVIQDTQTFKNNSGIKQMEINQQYPQQNNIHNNVKQYQSVSVAEQLVPAYESIDNYQSSQFQEFDNFLPITNQICQNNGKQIELHTNLSLDDLNNVLQID